MRSTRSAARVEDEARESRRSVPGRVGPAAADAALAGGCSDGSYLRLQAITPSS